MAAKRNRRSTPATKPAVKPVVEPKGSGGFQIGLLESFAFIVIFFMVWLALALITYDAADPAWSFSGLSNSEKLINQSGLNGAWLSDWLYSWFGYGVMTLYAVPIQWVYRFIRAQPLLSHRNLDSVMRLLAGTALLVLATSSLIEIYVASQSLPQSSGGIFGRFFVERSVRLIGVYGASLLFLAVIIFALTWTNGLVWTAVLDWIGRSVLDAITGTGGALKNLWLGFIRGVQQSWQNRKKRKAEALAKKASLRAQQPPVKPRADADIAGSDSGSVSQAGTAPEGKIGTPDRIPRKKPSKPPAKATAQAQASILDPVEPVSELPQLDSVLSPIDVSVQETDPKAREVIARQIEQHLLEFGLQVQVVGSVAGPVVTRYELMLAAGLKISRVVGLAKDIARALAVSSVRIVEVIEGKSVIGIEVPNTQRRIVRMADVLASVDLQQRKDGLPIVLGQDISGAPVVLDLARMPHMLMAGTTGSGKSVGINVLLMSLLMRYTPSELRLIMVDPKMLELSAYAGIPHLITPVITDMNEAADGLRWCVTEMEARYRVMASLGVRNLQSYNQKLAEAGGSLPNPLAEQDPELPMLQPLPWVVVVIDELADMMMIVGKKVEQLIARVAQKARASGIHLVLATQRPSVDVITGLIKANIPARVSYQVSSRIDSRTILDAGGAEQLLGHGDMLFLAPGKGVAQRIHGAFADDAEVRRLSDHWRQRSDRDWELVSAVDLIADSTTSSAGSAGLMPPVDEDEDPLYEEALEVVVQARKASISWVQRRLKIGYNRAARIVESMEARGVVGPPNAQGIRQVLKQNE